MYTKDSSLTVELKLRSLKLKDNAWVMIPAGSVDSLTSPQLSKGLDGAKEQGCRQLLLDMRQVKYLSSMGLGVITRFLNPKSGVTIALYDAQPAVRRVLEISKLDFLLLRWDKLGPDNPFFDYLREIEKSRSQEKAKK